jgi:hypothetical protein
MRKWILGALLIGGLSAAATKGHADDYDTYGQACLTSGCAGGSSSADAWQQAQQDPEIADFVNTLLGGSWCQRTWDCLYGSAVEDVECTRGLTTIQKAKIAALQAKICGDPGRGRPKE